MLAAKNVDDADERVIHQLLDFAHRELSKEIHDVCAQPRMQAIRPMSFNLLSH